MLQLLNHDKHFSDKVRNVTSSLKNELTFVLLSKLVENCRNHLSNIPFTNLGALHVWNLLFYGADPTADVFEADPSIRSCFTSSALHYAMGCNCTTTIDLLIKYGADVNCLDSTGLTPLMIGVEHRNLELIEHLIISHGADPNYPGRGGMTALHFAVKVSDNPRSYRPVVEFLLGLGADPNLQTLKGHTPLGICCSRQDTDTASLLLENGAQVEGRNTNSFTPLHLAVVFEAQEIAEMLLTEYNADVHAKAADGVLPIHCAIYSNSIAMAGLLIEHGALRAISYPTFYLHNVCQRCSFLDMLQLFMHHLAVNEVSYVDAHQRTPLHYAVMNPQTQSQAVQFLLDCGSDINVTDTAQLTPLQLAFYMRPNDPILTVLVEHVMRLHNLGMKVTEANLITLKQFQHPGEVYFGRLNQREIQDMSRCTIKDGFAITYHQLFTLPVRRLIRFLRLQGVRTGLLSRDLNELFPLYGNIIRNHVQQMAERAEIHNVFATFCYWVFQGTPLFSRGFVERFMSYFSDEEMLEILER